MLWIQTQQTSFYSKTFNLIINRSVPVFVVRHASDYKLSWLIRLCKEALLYYNRVSVLFWVINCIHMQWNYYSRFISFPKTYIEAQKQCHCSLFYNSVLPQVTSWRPSWVRHVIFFLDHSLHVQKWKVPAVNMMACGVWKQPFCDVLLFMLVIQSIIELFTWCF